MSPLDLFENYLEKGIVRKRSPDKLRSKDLIEETKDSYEFLNEIIHKIGINNKNANHIIKNSYDVIIELIRAKMHYDGYSASGKGAHEAEVSYLRKLNFLEEDVNFLNQLRYFRNRITYYGKILDEDYAENVVDFLNKIYTKLIRLFEEGND